MLQHCLRLPFARTLDMKMEFDAAWLVPQWPAPPWVRALMTTREGGISQPPFDAMNLGDHVGDDARAVAHNRQHLQQQAQMQAVFLQQIHGSDVAALDASSPGATEAIAADACLTTTPGVACTIMVADCLPVLLAHRSERIVGAAHAGWRGLAGGAGQGVLENLLAALRQQLHAQNPHTQNPHADAKDWLAWLGPCIGPQAFEVGDEVRQAFVAQHPAAAACFAPVPAQAGKWRADLPALARLRLADVGVQAIYGNNSTPAWCTFTQAERFYSYRRSSQQGDARTGRMAAAVWLA